MKKQRLYAIVVHGLSDDNIVFSIGPFSQAIFTRKHHAEEQLRQMLKENIANRASFGIERGMLPDAAYREARKHYRNSWRVATFERIS